MCGAIGEPKRPNLGLDVEWDIDANLPLYTRDYLRLRHPGLGDEIWSLESGDIARAQENATDEHWADAPDREQFEGMLGHPVEDWQWDWVVHYSRGERLVRIRRHYRWVKDTDLPEGE